MGRNERDGFGNGLCLLTLMHFFSLRSLLYTTATDTSRGGEITTAFLQVIREPNLPLVKLGGKLRMAMLQHQYGYPKLRECKFTTQLVSDLAVSDLFPTRSETEVKANPTMYPVTAFVVSDLETAVSDHN